MKKSLENAEPSQKRLKEQVVPVLAENADHAAIRLWLRQIKLCSDSQIYESLSKIFREYPIALLERLLAHFSTVDLMDILSKNTFLIIQCLTLTEFIAGNIHDLENSSRKLLLMSIKILSDHELLTDDELESYWKMVSLSIKPSVLQSLEIRVFASLFTRASDRLTKDLVPHLRGEHWLSVFSHNNFLFCRTVVCAKDSDLALVKFGYISKHHVTESHHAIMLAFLKAAVLENRFEFFQRFTMKYKSYIEILLSLDTFDLLIKACNSPNPIFLNLLIPNISGSIQRRTLILIVTWLSMQLYIEEMEHDHLRRSILADLNNIIVASESGELSDDKKLFLQTMRVMQVEIKADIRDLQSHITDRSNQKKHYCLDEKEIAVARVLNKYLGYHKFEPSTSQASQLEKHQQIKLTLLSRFDVMDAKSLGQEIDGLLIKLAPYRSIDISVLRRLIIPRATLSEQKMDAEDYISIKMDNLSPHVPAVWIESLDDVSLWPSSVSVRYDMPGTDEHMALGAALISRNTPFVNKPMLLASFGFFVQLKKDMKQVVRVPVRIRDQSVVKISPDVPILTDDTGAFLCEHPLKRLLYYLRYDTVMPAILRKAFDQNHDPVVMKVHAVTLDCHTNTMPCADCLNFAAETQKKSTILNIITSVLKSRNIAVHAGNLAMLIRISLQSFVKIMQPEVREALPESKFTPPDSQLSPLAALLQQANDPSKVDQTSVLLTNTVSPKLVCDIGDENCPPPQHFRPKYLLRPKVMPGMKTLSMHSIVIAKLPITQEDLDHKHSPDAKEYTALLGSCSSLKNVQMG